MNALKHAQASDFWIIVRGDEEFLELQLRDNGVGFDSSLPGPEGHFGMTMMRERAQDRWWDVRGLQRPGSGDDDHGSVPDLAAPTGTVSGARRYRAGMPIRLRGMLPPVHQESASRRPRFSRNRPRVTVKHHHAIPPYSSTSPIESTTPNGGPTGITSASGRSTSASVIR